MKKEKPTRYDYELRDVFYIALGYIKTIPFDKFTNEQRVRQFTSHIKNKYKFEE